MNFHFKTFGLTWLVVFCMIVSCGNDPKTIGDNEKDTDSYTDDGGTDDCACGDINDCCDGCNPIAEGESCNDGDLCTEGETCQTGLCTGGADVDCSNLDGNCVEGECNPSTGDCVEKILDNGTPCNDSDDCTQDEVCDGGACLDYDGPDYLFEEDFGGGGFGGWTTEAPWQIGPAMASTGCSMSEGMTQDPSEDHTPHTTDNYIGGVNIGGCTGTALGGPYCITSPIVDTSGLDVPALSYWRWLNSDYANFMVNTIDVYDGTNWVNIFMTGTSPATADLAWTNFTYDLSAYKGANTQIRWCYSINQDGAYDVSGWNIDDVVIGENACIPST